MLIYLAWGLLGFGAFGALYCNRRYPELAGVAGLVGALGAGLAWGWKAGLAGVALAILLAIVFTWWRFR